MDCKYKTKDYMLIVFIAGFCLLLGFVSGGYVAVNDQVHTMELALK